MPQENSCVFLSNVEYHVDFVDKFVLLTLDILGMMNLVVNVERRLLLLRIIIFEADVWC